MKRVVVFGATSAIAKACARIWAARGDRTLLVGRSDQRLAELAADLATRSGHAERVSTYVMDAASACRPEPLVEEAFRLLGGVDIVLIAHGTLPDQTKCESSSDALLEAIQVNGVSPVTLMAAFSAAMRRQGSGIIAVIGSVAGDRGRASNYAYGAAKAMVATFAAGLRHRLQGSGVHVLTVKPGFVDTPMTASFARKGLLWVRPERVAVSIVRAIDSRRSTVYVPWFWRWIMLIIRSMPEAVFLRTRL